MGHSGRSCISAFISYEGRGILSIWNEFQLWFQIKIRSLFKWYFLICVLCYCYLFVCVSVFILQVILHLWYKQVICKKKKQKQKEQYTSCSLRKNWNLEMFLFTWEFFFLWQKTMYWWIPVSQHRPTISTSKVVWL